MIAAVRPNVNFPDFQPVVQDPLYKRVWTAIANFFVAIAGYIKAAAVAVWAFMVRVWTAIVDFFSAVVEKIKTFVFRAPRPQGGFALPPGVTELAMPALAPAAVHAPRLVPISDIPAPILQGLQINRQALARIPKPFDPAIITHIANNTVPVIQAAQIIDHFNAQFGRMGEHAVLYNDQGIDIRVADARHSIQRNYLDFIRQYKDGADGYASSVAKNFELYLKAIVFEMRKPEISVEKKQEALKCLASAAEHCPPRRHEQVFKIYRVLSNQIETLEDIVLQYIQQTKEDLFYDYYSLSREPVMTLNYIRREIGQELGLDCNEINLTDPHINMNDARSPENRHERHRTPAQFRGVFNRIYTPANLLSIMKHFLNQRIVQDNDFTAQITQFIANEIDTLRKNGTLTQAEEDALPAPYQFDLFKPDGGRNETNAYHITNEGIRFLMMHFGFLRSDVPNVHLVRAQPAPAAVGA